MVTDDKLTEHPSYAIIGVSRVRSNGTALFDSEVLHETYIQLTISRAVSSHDAGRTWVFSRDQLISVQMTEAQFTLMVCSLNVGDGVPCTLNWFDGAYVAAPPAPPPIENELMADVQETIDRSFQVFKAAQKLCFDMAEGKTSITKNKIKELSQHLSMFDLGFKRHLPWVMEQVNRSVRRTVDRARQDIVAHAMMVGSRVAGWSRQTAKEENHAVMYGGSSSFPVIENEPVGGGETGGE